MNSDSKFVFQPKLRNRQEVFGGILFLTPRKWVPVDKLLYNFFNTIVNKEFDINVFANALGVMPDEAVPTAGTLLRKEILVERR